MDLLSLAIGIGLGSAANHFLPRLWRFIDRQPGIRRHIESDLSIIWAGSPPWVGSSFLVPTKSVLGDPPGSCPDWWTWARERGGVDADESHIQVTLTPTRDDVTVVVDGLRARVHGRKLVDSSNWKHVICPVGGADITPDHYSIDLDCGVPSTIQYVSKDQAQREAQPAFSISKGEVRRLDIMAKSGTDDVLWSVELLLLVDGKRQTIDVGSASSPFRTVAANEAARLMWSGGRWNEAL